MKKGMAVLSVLLFIVMAFSVSQGNARMGSGMMGGGYGGGGMGHGMMGPGMMEQRYGYDYGPPSRYGYGPQYREPNQFRQPETPLDRDQAKKQVQEYLRSTRNPNLKMGKIEENDNDYEVDIVTRDGALADKLLVDKDTGRMRSAY